MAELKYKILDNINSPKDLKDLSLDDLELLSDELTDYIKSTVKMVGGHYSKPLAGPVLHLQVRD